MPHRPRLALLFATIAIVTAGGLTACGGDGDGGGDGSDAKSAGYPEQVEKNFLKACEVQGTPEKCKCALANVEERFTLDQFKNEEAAISAGRKPSRKLTGVVAECS
jgi:hypothetical protein